MKDLIFQQLFEPSSSTYSYLLADRQSLDAVFIDPVLDVLERDLKLIAELGLKLRYVLDTHIHADHVTGSGKISDATGAEIAMGKAAQSTCTDIQLGDGDTLMFGDHQLTAIATPGHTASCTCYLIGNRVFTGDTLLFRGCGRTDFQGGSAANLFNSITRKLFTLPETTLVYPGHDYNGFTSSNIGDEKQHNPRIGGGKSSTEFVAIMNALKLAPPKNIAIAVPANLKCGRI